MNFNQVYSQLNSEQKTAVDHIEGPLLVLAGPGTGKTQLLGARVANILTKTDSRPENILCLTFTEKAANNMKQRLLDMIGPNARKVVIKTFHGFGAEVINSNPDNFWNAARLEPAPDAVRLELITELLSKLPLSDPLALSFSGQYTLIDDVLKAISKAKEAGLTPEKLTAITQANLAYLQLVGPTIYPLAEVRVSKAQITQYQAFIESLPKQTHDPLTAPLPSIAKVLRNSLIKAIAEAEETGKMSAISEWKKGWFEVKNGQKVFQDIRKSTWWLSLATIYEAYQKHMQTNRYFDFADMILEVITQLEQNETLRTELQERFNYILIDEFQDTNDAQFRLTHLIANHPAAEGKPNIMAVGDDDQAIYRFQGAQISNAKQFMESYQGTKLVVLTKNYRSHQIILDAAEQVAIQIEHRLINSFTSLNKHIISAQPQKNGEVTHLQFLNQAEQYYQLAEQIAQNRKQSVHSTVILARKHSSLEKMAAELNRLEVPIRYERSSNILEHPLTRLITDLARLLQAIHTGDRELVNSLLAEILPHPSWGISARTLWDLALRQKTARASWLDLLLEHKDPSLASVANWLLELSRLAHTQPLQVTLEYLLGLRALDMFCSPIKDFYASQSFSSEYLFSLTALERIRSLSAEYAKTQNPSLDTFITYLKVNQDHHVVLANEAAVITGDQPVELMTVHKAKGLEFNTVYVIDAIETHWRPSRRGRTPPSNLETLQSYGEDSDDYARLLFVALTRAEQQLIVSSFQFDEHGKEVLPSSYLHHLPISLRQPSGANREVAESMLRWPALQNEQRTHLIKGLLEGYQLSATGLIDFLDITQGGPEHFLNRHLLRLPEMRSAHLSFGSAIHSALEHAQRLVNNNNFNLSLVLEHFNQVLQGEYLSKNDQTRYQDHGQQLLEKIFNEKLMILQPGDYAERRIEGVLVDKSLPFIPLKGVLDLVQKTESGICIVDYKTGRPLSSLTTTSQAEGIKAWKHRLQLTFYALLASESGLVEQERSMQTKMVYLEAEDPRRMILKFQPSPEDLEHLTQLIAAVCHRLIKGELPEIAEYTTDLTGILQFQNDLIKQR